LQAVVGLDEIIVAHHEDPKKTDFSMVRDVDVVLDYVYGPLAEHLLESLHAKVPCTYVSVGGLSGSSDITISGSVLRSKKITLVGSGKGSWTMEEWNAQVPRVLEALAEINKKPVTTSTTSGDHTVDELSKIIVMRLEDVETEWGTSRLEGDAYRLVFQMFEDGLQL